MSNWQTPTVMYMGIDIANMHQPGLVYVIPLSIYKAWLTHWDWVMYIWVSKVTIIGSDNGLWPRRRQTIIWTNTGILLIGPLGTNCSEILMAIETFSLKKMHLKMSYGEWWPLCLGLDVLTLEVLNSYQEMHLHFQYFLNTNIVQVVEILCGWQGLSYPALLSISWLPMT